MRKLHILLPAALTAFTLAAQADPGKNENGHGKGRGHDRREFKEEYWDGNCKVERKMDKRGNYKEERKCERPSQVYYQPAPVYVPAAPVPVAEPGITIHGTVRIPAR